LRIHKRRVRSKGSVAIKMGRLKGCDEKQKMARLIISADVKGGGLKG
jgi:hypothetical protein